MTFWVIRMAVVKFRCFISAMLWAACVFECHVVDEHHDFASWQRNRSSAEQSVSLTLKILSNFLGGHFNTLSGERNSVQVLGLRCHFIAQSLRQEENPVRGPASCLWKEGGDLRVRKSCDYSSLHRMLRATGERGNTPILYQATPRIITVANSHHQLLRGCIPCISLQ